MLAFAANSLLARLALSNGDIDPLGYTGLRLVSGAVVLVALVYFKNRGRVDASMGSWSGALSLFFYAGAFSTAYILVSTGMGALILFASVQIGMLAWAIYKGDRPVTLEWLGIAIAFIALVYLISPGLVAPPLPGALLMIGAGLSWAAYSLLGRGSQSPLTDTAGNFVRCLPIAIILIVIGMFTNNPSTTGAAYAVISGAIASGLGYTIWYNVLPKLSRTRAAFVQLTVPSLAAIGGMFFLGEPLSERLVIATIGIIGGVVLALLAAKRRNSFQAEFKKRD